MTRDTDTAPILLPSHHYLRCYQGPWINWNREHHLSHKDFLRSKQTVVNEQIDEQTWVQIHHSSVEFTLRKPPQSETDAPHAVVSKTLSCLGRSVSRMVHHWGKRSYFWALLTRYYTVARTLPAEAMCSYTTLLWLTLETVIAIRKQSETKNKKRTGALWITTLTEWLQLFNTSEFCKMFNNSCPLTLIWSIKITQHRRLTHWPL